MRVKLLNILEICRPKIILGAISFAILGIILATGTFQLSKTSIISIITVAILAANIYTFNAATDRHEDKINKPNSPLIKNRLTGKEIVFFSTMLATITLILSTFLSIYSLLTALSLILTGIIYSYTPKWMKLKRIKEQPLIKNIIIGISWTGFALIPYFAFTTHVNASLFYTLLFVAINVIIGSLLGDISDVEGDAKAGITTIPTLIGAKKSLMVCIVATIASGIVLIPTITMLPTLHFEPIAAVYRLFSLLTIYFGFLEVSIVYNTLNMYTYPLIAACALIGVI